MGDAALGAGEGPDLLVVDVDRVGEPDIRSQPADILHPFDRPLAEPLERIPLLVQRFAKMRVQHHAFVAREIRALPQ
jgi:hypothetical protein